MVFTVKARVGTPGMDRLAGACQRGDVPWYQAVQWVDRYVTAAAQRAVVEAIDTLASAEPQQWEALRVAITHDEKGRRRWRRSKNEQVLFRSFSV